MECEWGEFSSFDSLINHSPNPNVKYIAHAIRAVSVERGGKPGGDRLERKRVSTVALRQIKAGDEITVGCIRMCIVVCIDICIDA